MAVLVSRLVREETFTFTPEDGDKEVSIRSGVLREWLHEKALDKVINITFPDEDEASIIKRHGLEADRMASMTEDEAKEPVIVGLWPNGDPVVIDGGHRRWFWAKRGVSTIRGWAVPYDIWKHFIIDFNAPPPGLTILRHYEDGALLPQRRKK
jgi:hypothetical protein